MASCGWLDVIVVAAPGGQTCYSKAGSMKNAYTVAIRACCEIVSGNRSDCRILVCIVHMHAMCTSANLHMSATYTPSQMDVHAMCVQCVCLQIRWPEHQQARLVLQS